MTRRRKRSTLTGNAIDAAIADLGLPAEDWRVQRYALLMVAHQRLRHAIMTPGEAFNIADLLRVDDAMAAIRASLPPEQTEITVKFVEGRSRTGDSLPAVEVKPEAPIEPEVEASAVPLPPPPAPAAPIAPPPRLDPGVASGSAFHNQIVGGERAPLKRLQNVALANNGHTRSSGAFDNYNNGGSLCFVASGSNGQRHDPIAPADPNPQRNVVTPLPTLTNGKGGQ